MQWRGLRSQVVISPREAPSQDLQNPAVARQVLWCVFFFFIFFCPSEDEEQEENKLWMEKDEDEKGEQDENGEDLKMKTDHDDLLFSPFSIHFCPSLRRSTGRGCGCSRHRGVQPWWPCLRQCHWSGSLISLDRGGCQVAGLTQFRGSERKVFDHRINKFHLFFCGILYKFWDLLFCFDAYINLYARFICTFIHILHIK